MEGAETNYGFTDKDYEEYRNRQTAIHNSKLRNDGEEIFSAMRSGESDLTKSENGQKILEMLKGLNNTDADSNAR